VSPHCPGCNPARLMGGAMSEEYTTTVVQRYLDELAGETCAEVHPGP
jgi:hypothetical protein